jgi:BTB/POZ domain
MSSADTMEESQAKKPRTGCVGEPDVIVVVGGKEFQEHSKHLRCWSDYFDAAFRSDMK